MVASTRHHRSRLLKYYPRPPCAPSFVKSRIFRPLQTHFLLFQQIFFALVCIHSGTPRVPPRVFASGPKPRGGKNHRAHLFRGISDRFFSKNKQKFAQCVWSLRLCLDGPLPNGSAKWIRSESRTR